MEGSGRKKKKCAELAEDCRRQGWRARCMPIEVGSRGSAGRSLCKAYSLLAITGAHKRKAISRASATAGKVEMVLDY